VHNESSEEAVAKARELAERINSLRAMLQEAAADKVPQRVEEINLTILKYEAMIKELFK
jgi:hypothetical protein